MVAAQNKRGTKNVQMEDQESELFMTSVLALTDIHLPLS